MRSPPLCTLPFGFALLLVLGGCAGTALEREREIAATGLTRPERVLVYDFTVDAGAVRQDSGLLSRVKRQLEQTDQTGQESQLGEEVADALAEELTTRIRGLGLNAARAEEGTPIRSGSIGIAGQFVNIDEGNRLRRIAIGLGAGESSLDAQVRVLAPPSSGERELAAFDTHADSGSMPGAGIMGPAGAAAGAGTAAVVGANAGVGILKAHRSAVTQEAQRMADKIAGELSKYFAQQGWIEGKRGE